VRVPDEAAYGDASVQLSLPDWKAARVTPATFKIPVKTQPSGDKK
jgi:hypothetical protein